MGDQKPDRVVDLREEVCPGSYVQALGILQEECEGCVVEFWFASGAALADAPKYMKGGGHQVVAMRDLDDEHVALVVRRGASEAGA